MKMKVQQLMDATLVVATIIREERPLPQKGKYRLARLHDKLNREFLIVNARRDVMITAYGCPTMVPNPEYKKAEILSKGEVLDGLENNVDPSIPKMIPGKGWTVPPDKLEEFESQWLEIGSEEIEIDAQPIPLEQLCLPGNPDGSISGHEFIILGDLVAE